MEGKCRLVQSGGAHSILERTTVRGAVDESMNFGLMRAMWWKWGEETKEEPRKESNERKQGMRSGPDKTDSTDSIDMCGV